MSVRSVKAADAHALSEVRPFPVMKTVPDAPVPEAPVSEEAPLPARRKRSAKSFLLPLIATGVLASGSWYGYQYWTNGRFLISTDDAYVQADMAFVAPKITGYVARRDVVENEHV